MISAELFKIFILQSTHSDVLSDTENLLFFQYIINKTKRIINV